MTQTTRGSTPGSKTEVNQLRSFKVLIILLQDLVKPYKILTILLQDIVKFCKTLTILTFVFELGA